MSIRNQALIVLSLYAFSIFSIWGILGSVKELHLNKSARKKRKQGQTFKEWFLYSRYREEIPKILLWLYFIILIVHPLALVCVGIAVFAEPFRSITSILIKLILVFDLTWIVLILLLSWKPGSPWLHYERWISKKKGKKK